MTAGRSTAATTAAAPQPQPRHSHVHLHGHHHEHGHGHGDVVELHLQRQLGRGDGGAIDSGDHGGSATAIGTKDVGGNVYTGLATDTDTGTLTVSASTFAGNSAGDGGAIDNGDHGGGATATTVGHLRRHRHSHSQRHGHTDRVGLHHRRQLGR